ncbi:MAG: hypothetical protein J2P37_30145, partial [Ktedonobacteraceae bacterium]|nr:hypothetical protein [Ktedonobacteraceae bacterium]
MNQWRERWLRSRAKRLAWKAQELRLTGRHEEALPVQEALLKIARNLALAHPEDPEELLHVPDELYNLASSLMATGRCEEASKALQESEQKYLELSAAGVSGIDALVADVQARKGLAQGVLGYGASAVMALDSAVIVYRRLFTGRDDDPHYMDLARVLALNAEVQWMHGDPDLAVASAESAIQLYSSRIHNINNAPDAAMHWGYLRTAASVASEIHAAQGRINQALTADHIAVQAARSLAVFRTALHLQALARAVTRLGLRLEAEGRHDEAEPLLKEGAELDPSGALEATKRWESAKTGNISTRVTLAASLAAAESVLGSDQVPNHLSSDLTGSSSRCLLATPSDRCDPQLAPTFAQKLAEISVALLPSMQSEGLRLGLEAHFLFAVSSRLLTGPTCYRLRNLGPPWARVL